MDANETPERFALGIVLVHGIGEHQQGETLLQFGEPLLECLQARVMTLWRQARDEHTLENFEPGTRAYFNDIQLGTKLPIYVNQATPMPLRRLDNRNASAEIRISVPEIFDAGAGSSKRVRRKRVEWKIVESWWGEQVIAPNAAEVIGWMFTRAPWIVGQFFYERAQFLDATQPAKTFDRAHKWFRRVRYTALALLASIAVQLLLAVFAVVGLIPMLSKWVAPLLLKVSGVLGDAYVLIVQDLQHAAIIDRLRITFQSLTNECDAMVAIPHSQGAGVVFDAITAAAAGGSLWAPDHVVSFGSGVAKLKTLFYAEARESGSFQVAGWSPLICAVPGLFLGFALLNSLSVAGWQGIALKAGSVALALALSSALFYRVFRIVGKATFDRCLTAFRTKAEKAVAPTAHGATWTDIYASHDPVPMGSLCWATQNETGRLLNYTIDCREIMNERSWLSDHVTYVKNKLELCLPLTDSLLRWTGISPPNPTHPQGNQLSARRFRELAHTRGAFEHLVMYGAVALLPFAGGGGGWTSDPIVKKINGAIQHYTSQAVSEPVSSQVSASPLVWAVIAMLAYGFLLVNIAHLQTWWRNEIAARRSRESPMNESTMKFAVRGLQTLYCLAFIVVFAFFNDFSRWAWILIAIAFFATGAWLLRVKSKHLRSLFDERRMEFDDAKHGA